MRLLVAHLSRSHGSHHSPGNQSTGLHAMLCMALYVLVAVSVGWSVCLSQSSEICVPLNASDYCSKQVGLATTQSIVHTSEAHEACMSRKLTEQN